MHARTHKLTVVAASRSSDDMRVADRSDEIDLVDFATGGWRSNLGGVHGRGRAVALVGARGVWCFRGRICERAAADAVPGGGKDHEEEAGEEPDRERQVGEEFVPVCRLTGDEAPLDAGVAEGEGHENGGPDDGVHQSRYCFASSSSSVGRLDSSHHPRRRTGTARG
jgi:hypothetical protein